MKYHDIKRVVKKKRRHPHIPTFKEMEQALNTDMKNAQFIKVSHM